MPATGARPIASLVRPADLDCVRTTARSLEISPHLVQTTGGRRPIFDPIMFDFITHLGKPICVSVNLGSQKTGIAFTWFLQSLPAFGYLRLCHEKQHSPTPISRTEKAAFDHLDGPVVPMR